MQVLRSGWFLFVCVAVLVVANIRIYQTIFAARVLEVSVLDMGKGRAVLVRAPSGATLLVDVGPDAGILRALGTALPPWQRAIDTVILTGSSRKCAGGLPDVASRYRVGADLRAGSAALPYGARIVFDKTISVIVAAPGAFALSYGAASLTISSTTPAGAYTSDGHAFIKTR